ncbi:A-kinase anchor protein 10 [Mactra antiquata]
MVNYGNNLIIYADMSFFRRHSEKKKKEKQASVKQKGQRSSSLTPVVLENKAEAANGQPGFNAVGRRGQGLLLDQDDFLPGDLGIGLQSSSKFEKKSKLSRNLFEVLKDHEAVTYLIQYMESCKASSLIRFYLDAESFQASTWTRIRTHSLQSVSKSSIVTEQADHSIGSMSKSINKDITSPVSVASVDSICDNSVPGISMSVSSDTIPESKNVTKADESLSEAAHQCPNQNNDKVNVNTKTEVVVNNEFPSDQECDTRMREKCKTDEKKTCMTLPLDNCNTTNTETAEKLDNSDGAISYRELALSPTGSTGRGRNNSQSSAKSESTSLSSHSNDLAQKLKKSVEQDAVRIFTKYLALEATHPINVTEQLRNDTIRKICREDGQVDPECFVECQQFAVKRINEEYFERFKSSVYHCKYQVEVLTSGKLCLCDIVYNDTALFYFMEYLEQESLSQLLHFIIAADNFENLLSLQETYDGLQAQEDAMVLYDKYFSLQASIPLGFPDNLRFEIESNICREEGPLPDCFIKPRNIVLHTIEVRHLQHYLTSDVYYKYLSELVSAVQTAQDFPIGQRKRRGSETSSEHSVGTHSLGNESISSKNTLLASGTSRRVQLNKLDENMKNMTLDDPSLLNPDKLWERPEAGKMSLGQIDNLGHFVSRFDPDPDSVLTTKKSSSGSKFFKSKKDKEKEQEEMARKVAEMILNDVTSVTKAVSAIKKDHEL